MVATANDDALDTLTALFPNTDRATLEQYLAASNGNLERAHRAIERGDRIVSHADSASRRRKRTDVGLEEWLKPKRARETAPARQADGPDVLVLSDSDDGVEPSRAHFTPTTSKATVTTTTKPPVQSAFAVLRPPRSFSSLPTTATTTPPAAPHVNLPPLALATPAMIARETRGMITLVENALPEELASRLFVKMVEASRGEVGGEAWKRNKWYMVDREVESPHTSAFYTEQAPPNDAEGWSEDSYNLAATHWYNGEFRQSRPFLPEMNEARALVGAFVNTLLDGRERNDMEWTRGEWRANAAAANCYRGAQESVGWHSDQLTHLGPYPTIASLTLGCTRPFRLRPFSPRSLAPDTSTSQPPKLSMRTLEIVLPHNSLLIMHGGTQETFKHCVPPVNGMDVFKLPKGSLKSDEAAGQGGRTREEVEALMAIKWRERINMTFRHYRPDFAPSNLVPPTSVNTPSSASSYAVVANSSGYTGTPLCRCGKPCILRPDGKGRVRSNLSTSTRPYEAPWAASSSAAPSNRSSDAMVFFWSCNAGAQNEGKGCGFFRVLDMEKEGRGRWFKGHGADRDKGTGAGKVEV
ncbi:hypothetical protein JCM10212_000722 [Sporobolomyces blumeae]